MRGAISLLQLGMNLQTKAKKLMNDCSPATSIGFSSLEIDLIFSRSGLTFLLLIICPRNVKLFL